MPHTALICLDLVNEMLNPAGKLAGKGYAKFAEDHNSFEHIKATQAGFRRSGQLVLHVRVGFEDGYPNHPTRSPLFGRAAEFGALKRGSWGTQFVPEIEPLRGETILDKPRVSAFFGTKLETLLRESGVSDVVLVGVATDLAVEATARDAHDRDFAVTVLSDGCIAASDQDQERSLTALRKVASVSTVAQLDPSSIA